MKKWIAMFLVCVMMLACTACQSGTGSSAPESSEAESSQPVASLEEVTVENPANYFTVTMGKADGSFVTLRAYDYGDGTAYVEYVGEYKKVGTMDLSVLHGITAELDKTEFAEMNGDDVYEEGGDYASLFVTFADETSLSASYSGKIPAEFEESYAVMDSYFQLLTAELPVYVPQAMVMGEVDADQLAAMQEILNGSGIEALDSLTITGVPMDEYFAMTMGLTASEGITAGTMCAPMMMTTPYSLVIVTVEDAANIDAVRQDFEANLDWAKWVCVMADQAVIAQKGNMVLCLMGSADLFTQTVDGINAAGWENVTTLHS